MEWPALIDRLSEFAGVEPYYFDIHGERHETATTTKEQVLGALSLDVSSFASAKRAVSDFECQPWRRLLPLCMYLHADAPNSIVELNLPAADSHRTWRWNLELETGDVLSGEFRPEQLDLLDARDVDGRQIERRRLICVQPLPAGYHVLRITGRKEVEGTIVAAPRWCYLPEPLEREQRLWGLATHVYSLRSHRNWGIGDLIDLKQLTAMAAQTGASFVTVNPLHALSPERPEHASPYSPSSRLFINPLYIGLEPPRAAWAADGVDELRRAPLVEYARVWSAKASALEELGAKDGSIPDTDFDAFKRQGGEALEDFAAFSTLGEAFNGPWHTWPARYRKPRTAAVKRFASERADRVRYYKYLQFLADWQLGEVGSEACRGGMNIGLIRDLALGVDPDGADAWTYQDEFIAELRCGAPRDDFNPEGQDWGVLPLNPLRLRSDHRTYAQLLRANMRHAGGLRIDHIIGIDRQFVVPRGGKPGQGCYLRSPTKELLSLIALESLRNKCMVIGEDLGTVPEGLRQRMHDARLFGCSVFYFERWDGGIFRAPSDYRKHTIASAGTHDLPTIAGYWTGRDIEAQTDAGVMSEALASDANARRSEDKQHLLNALAHAGVLEPTQIGDGPTAETLRKAVHAYLAASAAQLFATQIDDILDEITQLNLPGTVDTYPNWRRKLRIGLEDPDFKRALSELARSARARSAPSERLA